MISTARTRLLEAVFRAKGNFAPSPPVLSKSEKGVTIAPFLYNAQCAVSFSADFELNWAFRGRSNMSSRGRQGRLNVPRLLEILEHYRIPITWATVGHLFLESCSRDPLGCPHPDMPRPPYNNRWEGDWYLHDPCTDYRSDPLWYAPDLVRAIQQSTVNHEFGTHSFSHINFASTHSNEELVCAEIEACVETMKPYTERPRTLVYPFNVMGHHYHELLSQLGITTVRHRDERRRLAYPQRFTSGLYRIYESMNLRVARYYHYPIKARLFIEEAKRRRAAFHLWFHPSDSWTVFETVFAEILEMVAFEREKGHVWAAPMCDVVAYCEARYRTEIDVDHEAEETIVRLQSCFDEVRYGPTSLTLVFDEERSPESIVASGPRMTNAEKIEIERRDEDIGFSVTFPHDVSELLLRFPNS